MPTKDNFFEAAGPGGAGFFTDRENFRIGAEMEGTELGVLGNGSLTIAGLKPPRRTGVWGRGDEVGVYGQTPSHAAGETEQAAAIVGSSRNEIAVAAFSDTNTAVYAQSGNNTAVYAQSGNTNTAVHAQSGNAAALQIDRPAAILATSSRNIAVTAVSNATVAVHAHSGAPHNFGVFKTGAVTATSSGSGHGVSALSLKFDAVHGASFGSRGVTGLSSADYGVYGLSFAPPRAPGTEVRDAPAGVRGQSMTGSVGVLGVADGTGAGIVGVGTGNALAGFFQGDLTVTGQIFAGIKDAMVPFPDGSKRLLHCMESPEHWFEDFGSARLTRGRVTVKLDADFASVVTLNEYRVFLTPEGDCQGLYVRKRGTSFEVRELQGGTSNVAFSYRIVAKRKDIKAHTRFAKIDTRLPIPTGKARAARGRKAARALLATLAKDARKTRRKPAVRG